MTGERRVPWSSRSGRPVRRTATVVGATAGLFVLLVAALQGDAATTLIVGVLVALAFVAWWRWSPAAAGSTLSLATTLVVTSAATAWAADLNPMVSPFQSGLVFWIFAGVVVGTAWLVRPHQGSRAVTTAGGHALLVAASPFVAVAPTAAPVLGLGAAMVLVGGRSWVARRGQRQRAGQPAGGGADPAAALRGVERTAAVVATDLPDGWHALGTRQLPPDRSRRGRGPATGRSARDGSLEQVLVGPGGLVVVESRNWPGVVSLVDLPEASDTDPVGQAYALDGDVAALAARLEPAARKLRQVMARLGTDPSLTFGIVVFWGATQLPGEHVALTLRAPEGERAADVELVLLRGEHLADWFRRAPHRLSRREVRRLVRHATVDLPALH